MSITERIDATTRIGPEYRAEVLPAPRSVKIELTGRCNYRCGFCALRTREKQPRQDMARGLFARIAGEMQSAGVREIGLFYLGEPFLSRNLLEFAIRLCKREIGIPYVFVTTNGSQANWAALEAVMAAGLDSLKFSVNAADEAQFAAMSGVRPALMDRALENLRKARSIRDAGGYATRLYASSIAYDDAQIERMRPLLEARVLPYVDEHYWLPLYSMGSFATAREEELGYRPIAGNQGRLGALREPLPCWAAFTEGHVRADGGLSACCFDASGEFVMADLTEVDFMSGWNSEAFRALRRAHLARDVSSTICAQCIAYQ